MFFDCRLKGRNKDMVQRIMTVNQEQCTCTCMVDMGQSQVKFQNFFLVVKNVQL